MIAKESLYFIVPLFLISLIFFILKLPCIAAFIIILAFPILYFFRNPERYPPEEEDLLVSPADGKVMSIEDIKPSNREEVYKRISIFMSPLDVHINRSPVDGEVEKIQRKGGGYLPAYKKESCENEKVIIDIKSGEVNYIVELIAGIMARRIKPYIKEGDLLRKGQRIGIIMLGSRVDFYFPVQYEVLVEDGARVKAGETAIVRRKK